MRRALVLQNLEDAADLAQEAGASKSVVTVREVPWSRFQCLSGETRQRTQKICVLYTSRGLFWSKTSMMREFSYGLLPVLIIEGEHLSRCHRIKEVNCSCPLRQNSKESELRPL